MASDNPLDPSPEHEAKVRERAYFLWKADGCPHGRHHEYWERARELQAIADSPTAGELPNPSAETGGVPPPTVEPVEEAQIQENLGEFPNRFTDQGERQMEPMTKPKAKRAARKSK